MYAGDMAFHRGIMRNIDPCCPHTSLQITAVDVAQLLCYTFVDLTSSLCVVLQVTQSVWTETFVEIYLESHLKKTSGCGFG